MTVPTENISNTVLLRSLPLTPPDPTWPMLIATTSVITADEQVELWTFNPGSPPIHIPAADFTIDIQIPNYWEFKITWTSGSPPAGPGTLYIFRRTRGVVAPFQVGSFLSAEALNQRLDLDNLGINDTAYYQSKANPMYSKAAIAEKGIPDPSTSPFSNPALPAADLRLPYLGTPPVVQYDVYTWGKEILNAATGEGVFKQVLIESATGGGTVAQLKAELLDCSSYLTAGGHLIGLWSAQNTAIGWPGVCMKLEDWFVKMSVTTPLTDTGGTQIGINISGAGNWNIYHTPGPGAETSVQTYCNGLHFFGDASHLHYDSGASWIGYSGWGLNTPVVAPDGKSYNANTVAGCLNRLNDAATSTTESGAEHVKWWTGTASNSVQTTLSNISDTLRLEAILPGPTLFPATYQIGVLPGDLFANPNLIDRVVWSARPRAGIFDTTWYSVERSNINLGTNNTTGLYPCYYLAGTINQLLFTLTVGGIINVTKITATTMDWDVMCVIYRKPAL